MQPTRAGVAFALCRAAKRSPRSALGAMLTLTLAGAVGLGLIEFRTDGQALVPRVDLAVRFDAEVRAEFGLGDPIVVHIETTHAAGIYNVHTLRLVQDLCTALADLPEFGPQKIMSLATEARPSVHPGTPRFRRLLDPFPDTPELMDRLTGDFRTGAGGPHAHPGRRGAEPAFSPGCPALLPSD